MEMDLQEIGREFVDWFQLAQDRFHWRVFSNAVINLRVP